MNDDELQQLLGDLYILEGIAAQIAADDRSAAVIRKKAEWQLRVLAQMYQKLKAAKAARTEATS